MTVVDPRSATQTAVHPSLPAPWPRRPDEPPAGLGPWVPPLPEPRPPLSPRALTWFGIAAVVLLISAAAATALLVAAAGTPQSPSVDTRYLGSVRGNSTLSGLDIDDDALVRTGHDVCRTVDQRPTVSNVLGTMHELGRTNGWNANDVAAVVGSAIGAYCPRHIAVLDG